MDARALQSVLDARPSGPLALVLNKIDLAPSARTVDFLAVFPPGLSPDQSICCSAATGEGIEALEDTLAQLALGGQHLDAESTLVENARQRQAIEDALSALNVALDGLRSERPPELVCIDLRSALEALGTITGHNVGEAVLARIFSDFCIGK
jgi:tRNA modification GTPase